MKIKILVSMAGVDFALSPGDVTERFGEEEAARLVQADFAMVIAEGIGGAVEDAVEPDPAAPAIEDPATDPAAVVEEPEAEVIAGPAPAIDPEPVAEVATVEADEKAALVAEAEALGIDVDGRWGVARLKAEIAAKKAAG